MMGIAECYRKGFGVEQNSQMSQRIGHAVAKDSPTIKDVFFKEWEKNVKENVVEWFKKWVKAWPTLPATPVDILHHKAGSNVLAVSSSVVVTRTGETPTGLWL